METLSWIERDVVMGIIEKRFTKLIKSVANPSKQPIGEPTLTIMRATAFNMTPEDTRRLNGMVNATKTLQNAVGLFHQDVLGSVPGWHNTGVSGGGFDIRSNEPVDLVGRKTILAEVKMRYNTIKASDEKKVFDDLYNAAKMNPGGFNDNVAYLFQIIPKKPVAFDNEWSCSGRQPSPHVRVVDGVTAYHLVTGVEDALRQLLQALPSMANEVIARVTGEETPQLVWPEHYIDDLILESLPPRSFYA